MGFFAAVFLAVALLEAAALDDVYHRRSDDAVQQQENATAPEKEEEASKVRVVDKMNVVLFLAQPNTSFADDDKGLKIIGMKKRATLQACSYKSDDIAALRRYVEGGAKTCNCDDILKSSLMSLINYSRNSRGMATAIASSTNETLPNAPLLPFSVDTNNEKNYYHYKVDSRGIPEEGETQLPLKGDADAEDEDAGDLPKIEPVEIGGDVRLFHALPNAKSKYGWPRRRSERPRPEHTQIFEINAGVPRAEPREIAEVPALKREEGRPKTLMELLGLMASIRNSFFNNFLYPEFDPEKRAVDEENGVSVNRIGQLQEPSYFELVKRTLSSAQKEGDDGGFLMAVIGGDLGEIANPYSNLVQSVKHVDENTDDRDTLLVLTGSCPRERMSADAAEKAVLPLYAKGPQSDIFSEAQNLFDVPRLIKKAMTKESAAKRKSDARALNAITASNDDDDDDDAGDEELKTSSSGGADNKRPLPLNERGNVLFNVQGPDLNQFDQFSEQSAIKEFIVKRQAPTGGSAAIFEIALWPWVLLLVNSAVMVLFG